LAPRRSSTPLAGGFRVGGGPKADELVPHPHPKCPSVDALGSRAQARRPGYCSVPFGRRCQQSGPSGRRCQQSGPLSTRDP
jgi:hypothetical protein